ncbi:MAG: outer membrane protein assembly factor BamD [Caldisericaceae bacterium]|nr:outer membrane protein assembly factor BamD [Caldisericaceae bacterium]
MVKNGIYLLIALFLFACAGVRPKPDWTAEQYFRYAKKLFEDEDYYEAANEFTVVTLRYPGSSVADSAQFYLAESHYMMKEYLIAAAEYEKLITNMSRSKLVPLAQYKLADSYYRLSPRPELDQEYTLKAIREFQIFIEDNPTHPLKDEALKKIAELRSKLALKELKNADIYRKMHEYRAAIIYYDQVLADYYDTEWADDALLGKIETYLEMGDLQSAAKEIEKFKAQFPESSLMEKVEKLSKKIPEAENEQVLSGSKN